jgi:hypothetical protein
MAEQPGLTLADIAGAREKLPVGDSFIEIRGVPTSQALGILQRFPHLAKVTTGFKISDLIAVAPGALAAIIAAGVGKYADAEAEADADAIPIEIQFDIVEAIGRLTFKNGFAPFVERLLALARAAKSDLFTKVPSMNLPATSKSLSPAATPPVMSSSTPQDKSPPTSSSPENVTAESVTPA